MNLCDTRIQTAGVFRCCFDVTDEELVREVKVGDKRNCQHCGREFELMDDNVWEAK